MAAIKTDPSKVVFGAGGSVGSQDWMKAALTARAGRLDPRSMRFVAFEGGGEAITALQGGHVQVYSGDAFDVSEAAEQIKAGPKVSDADFKVWSDTFAKMMATPQYDQLRAERGLFKFALTGKELDAFIKDRMVAYRQLASDFKPKVAN